jgi:hypothetical protein
MDSISSTNRDSLVVVIRVEEGTLYTKSVADEALESLWVNILDF